MSVEAAIRNTVLAPGDMLGCYRIQDFLGRGGFGVTYLALDTRLDLQVAIKEYLPEQIAERTVNKAVQPKSSTESSTFNWGLSRFITEAQTLAKFKHHSIVRVMAVFEQNGTAYMVMEYERGQELKELIRNRDMCTEANLQKLIGPVIDGLSEVHRHGYIHRDIKPANILIREDRSPVLLDFGSARLATGAQTQSLTALVSVGYAPLEQYNDNSSSQQGPWTDVYALGAVLYFAITGQVPVDSTLRGSAFVNDQRDPLTPLAQIAPEGVSIEFCEAIDWALNFKIKDRPQSLKQWRSKLLSDNHIELERAGNLPPLSTRPLDRQEVSPNEQTARNQSFEAYLGGGRHTAGSRSRSVSDSRQMAASHTQLGVHGIDREEQWDTTRGTAQPRSPSRYRSASSHGRSRARNSRTRLFAGLLIASSIVAVVTFHNTWLPSLLALVSNGTISPSSDVIVVPQVPADRAVTPVREQAEIPPSATQDEIQANAQLSEPRSEIERKRELENQRLQVEQLEADARRAAETLKREKEAQTAASAANSKTEQAAALAERQARDNASRTASEAARQSQRAAQQSTTEKPLGPAEQATSARPSATLPPDEAKQVASLETPETPPQPSIDVTRPITDADIKSVLKQFEYLRMAIAAKDKPALQSLAFPSERNGAYLDHVFETFDSIEVTLNGVGASPGEQTIKANLNMISMQRSNGDVVYPPDRFKTIPIYSKRSGEWSRIYW
ncbi:MAG: protein kinase [Granulosicoccus sp.]